MKQFVMLIMLAVLASCAKTSTTETLKGNTQIACQVFDPIGYAAPGGKITDPKELDSESTINEINVHNLKYDNLCGVV